MKMEGISWLALIWLIMMCSAFLVVFPIAIILEKNIVNSDCVKQIAQDFCESQGYNFSEVTSSDYFRCKNIKRIEGDKFEFLKGEVRECLRR